MFIFFCNFQNIKKLQQKWKNILTVFDLRFALPKLCFLQEKCNSLYMINAHELKCLPSFQTTICFENIEKVNYDSEFGLLTKVRKLLSFIK